VLHDGVREVAERLWVDTALLHLGGVRFPFTGPLRYAMTARDAVELCRLVRPRTAVPIHYRDGPLQQPSTSGSGEALAGPIVATPC
jgi:L-ascorbate metabolism protein UlaG (beta-lactamase superfamily)